MRKIYWVLIGFVGLALVGSGAYFIAKKFGPITDFEAANPTGLGAPEILGQLDFKKSLFLQHGAISIDDGPMKAIPCDTNPPVFATIQIEAGLMGDLSCVNDYLGGIKISYNIDGEVRNASIAQRDADGGDVWDARSFILRDTTGRLIIQTETASSGESLDGDGEEGKDQNDNETSPTPGPMECSMAVSAQAWNSQSKTFEPAPPLDDGPTFNFQPPINVASECLNKDGSWKGR